MSAPNTIPMQVLLNALAALQAAETALIRVPGGAWEQVMHARVALKAELGSMQPVQVEGGPA